MEQWQNVRVWFEKRGRAKYISHLDLMRAMSRAVRRAALPLWYTEGFHPHPYLSFPLPLPLGQEGLREALDLRLEQALPEAEIAARLGAALPEGIRVLCAAEPWAGPGEIKSAAYTIAFACDDQKKTRDKLQAGQLTAKKTGKQGHRKIEKEILLAPLIFSYDLQSLPNGGTQLGCTLAAGSEGNLNPALLCDALGIAAPQITRVQLQKADGSRWE
ncbi:MAG: TIGR03936 family radical SAM-associated protein [Oscillospiraceae bacterium]|jgi:radical SAM-linked protein|nr:TIGR03936 family radical SAM-associated protein [Oscillospiraceae bacterium]